MKNVFIALLMLNLLNAQNLQNENLQNNDLKPINHAQNLTALNLENAINLAKEHYPLSKNKAIINEALNLEITRLKMNYIPHIRAQGKASYQSDVTTLPFNSGAIADMLALQGFRYKPLSKDQYNINLEIAQPLIDMALWANKPLTTARYEQSNANVENALYSLQKSVINAFFSLALLHRQISQSQVHIAELENNLKTLQSLHNNGIIARSEIDKLDIELLNAKKSLLSLNAKEHSTRAILATLTNIDENFRLILPDTNRTKAYLADISEKINAENIKQNVKSKDFAKIFNANAQHIDSNLFATRPETKIFSLKIKEANAYKYLERAKALPYVDLFFQAGYANPALNILQSGFQGYYIAGIRLNWDFSNFYTTSIQNQLIQKNTLQIRAQEEEFLLQAKIALIDYIAQANAALKEKEESEKIIALQERILATSRAKINNGTMSVNDLLSDINKLHSLRLLGDYEEIEFLMQVFLIRQHLNQWD